MRILILHQNRYARIAYDAAIDHRLHDVVYAATKEYLGGIPEGLRCDTLVIDPAQPLLDQLRAWIGTQPPFDRIIGRHESFILSAAQLRDEFGIPGMGTSQAVLFRDKILMKQAVAAAGIRVPRNLPAADALSLEAPWTGKTVVKPRDGAGSAGIEVLPSFRDAVRFLQAKAESGDAGKEFLQVHEAEEFIDGEVWHVDGYLHGSEPVVIQASRYVGTCLEFEHGMPSGSVQYPNPQLEAWAVRCLHALGARDLTFHLEGIVSEQGPVFLEVAARCGGGHIVDLIDYRHGVRLHLVDMASDIEGRLADRFAQPRASGYFYGDFLFPGHRLQGRPCRISDDRRLLKWDGVVQFTAVPPGIPLPTTRSYRPENLPLSGIGRATDPDQLVSWIRDLFDSVEILSTQ